MCLEEIEDSISDNIRYNALSHRASKAEQDEFNKFMEEAEPTSKKDVVIDHEAQMKMARG